ncbi:MAG: hypothetical protein ACE5K7_00635 [Phycisphaerae bacterium]
MIKWFRKHNKKLLAIVAAALLVVWLGGTALRSALQPDTGGQVVARAFGRQIERRQRNLALVKGRILQELGLNWQLVAFGLVPGDNLFVSPPILEPDDWFCLTSEARQMGVVITQDQIQRFLQNQPGIVERIQAVRENRNVSLAFVHQAIADYLRVRIAAMLAMRAAKVSEPQLRQAVRTMYEKVRVRLVALPARQFIDPGQPLSEAELQQHFDKYKDVLPGQGESLGYGYRWPDRVMVEYLMADIDKIKQHLPRPPRRQLIKYYNSHRQDFTETIPTTTTAATASSPTTTTAAASGPATRLRPLAEVRDQVIDRLLTDKALNIAGQIMGWLSDQLQEPWYGVRPGPDGYKQAPPEVKREGYLRDLAQQVTRTRRIPLMYRRTGMLTPEQAAAEPHIGQAFARDEQNRPLPFAQYAFRVKGLASAPQRRGPAAGLSLYEVPRSPLRDLRNGKEYNYYLFRVIRAVPSAVPASIDEVRQRVEQDLREYKAYLEAGRCARQLARQAARLGLAQAVDQASQLKRRLGEQFRLLEPEPFPRVQPITPQMVQFGLSRRRPPTVPGVGRSQRFVAECFKMAASLTTTQPSRVRAIELPRLKRHVVVELVATLPISPQQYRQKRQQLLPILQIEQLRRFRNEWFDSQHIRQRAGFSLTIR